MPGIHAILHGGFSTSRVLTFGRQCLPIPRRSLRTTNVKQSRWPNKSSSGRTKTNLEPPAETPFEGVRSDNGPIQSYNLLKPLGFTVAFSAASFTAATIWQYENMRSATLSLVQRPMGWVQDRLLSVRKQGSFRQEISNWWNSLSEGERLFVPICFANCLVFAAWRVPRLQGVMVQYFCSNPASKSICWPMLLSTFSHYSGFHLLANMYVLHSFSSGAVAALGKEQFLGLYLSAGVVSSMASYLYKAMTHQPGLSLGASGAIMAVLGYVCVAYPDTQLSIIFLPMFTFSAFSAIKVIMALDAAGVLLRWKFFDHAAHLGGALCGIAWCYWGNTYIWQKREPLLQWWHRIRETPRK